MKKKILALCLLTVLCLPVFCEMFHAEGATVLIDYEDYWKSRGRNIPDNWAQICDEAIHRAFVENDDVASDFPINKLSNTDIRLINKALQRFEFAKGEIYRITIAPSSGVRSKQFFVLITGVKGKQYWWEWVGRYSTR